MQRLLTILALALFACTSRVAPEPDAGQTPTTAAVASPAAVSAPRAPSGGPPPTFTPDGGSSPVRVWTPRKPRKAAPPDPRVVACANAPGDKQSLMACLDTLKVAPHIEADAGAGKHLLAAIRPPIINPFWQVPDLYLSPSGSNGNTCTTAGSPCQQWGELMARAETDAPILSTMQTVHILGDLPNMPADYVHWKPTVLNTGAAIILCSPATLNTNTITSLTAKNRNATGAYPTALLQANLGTGAAQGLLAVNTSRSSSLAWIDSISGGISVLTQPMAENAGTWTAVPATNDLWANGDTVVIKQPIAFYMSTFDPTPATSGSFSADDFVGGFIGGGCRVKDPTTTSFHSSVELSRLVMASEVRFDGNVLESGSTAFHSIGSFSNDYMPDGADLIGAFVFGGSATGLAIAGGLDADVILHGTTFVLSIPDVTVGNNIGDVYFDNSEVQMNGTGRVFAANYGNHVYGRYALEFQPGSAWTYATPATSTLLGSPSTAVASRLSMYRSPFAWARDTSHVPISAADGRALDVPVLDTAVSSGGFGGAAYGDSGQSFTQDGLQATATPSAYFVAGSGISLTGCGAGGTCTIASTVSPGSTVTFDPMTLNGVNQGAAKCDKTVSTCTFGEDAQTTDTGTNSVTFSSQDAWSSATTNKTGGTLNLQGGAGTGSGTSGTIFLNGHRINVWDTLGGGGQPGGNIQEAYLYWSYGNGVTSLVGELAVDNGFGAPHAFIGGQDVALVGTRAYYGDGSDGTATCDGSTAVAGMSLAGGNYTLTRDVYFSKLTINSAVSVIPNGWRIFVSNVLSFAASSTALIDCSGGNASGGTGGSTPGGATVLGAGAPGGNANSNGNGTGNSAGFAGQGGNGGGLSNHGTLGAMSGSGFRDLAVAESGSTLNAGVWTQIGGGSGGGGGANGGGTGGGGGGAGCVELVAARVITGGSTGLGNIRSNGGNGAAASGTNASGGGGGGGGGIFVIYSDKSTYSGGTSATGGVGGSPTGTGTAGGTGSDGTVVLIGG